MQLLLPRDRLNLNIRNGANVGAMASSPDAGDRLPLGYDSTKLQAYYNIGIPDVAVVVCRTIDAMGVPHRVGESHL